MAEEVDAGGKTVLGGAGGALAEIAALGGVNLNGERRVYGGAQRADARSQLHGHCLAPKRETFRTDGLHHIGIFKARAQACDGIRRAGNIVCRNYGRICAGAVVKCLVREVEFGEVAVVNTHFGYVDALGGIDAYLIACCHVGEMHVVGAGVSRDGLRGKLLVVAREDAHFGFNVGVRRILLGQEAHRHVAVGGRVAGRRDERAVERALADAHAAVAAVDISACPAGLGEIGVEHGGDVGDAVCTVAAALHIVEGFKHLLVGRRIFQRVVEHFEVVRRCAFHGRPVGGEARFGNIRGFERQGRARCVAAHKVEGYQAVAALRDVLDGFAHILAAVAVGGVEFGCRRRRVGKRLVALRAGIGVAGAVGGKGVSLPVIVARGKLVVGGDNRHALWRAVVGRVLVPGRLAIGHV